MEQLCTVERIVNILDTELFNTCTGIVTKIPNGTVDILGGLIAGFVCLCILVIMVAGVVLMVRIALDG